MDIRTVLDGTLVGALVIAGAAGLIWGIAKVSLSWGFVPISLIFGFLIAILNGREGFKESSSTNLVLVAAFGVICSLSCLVMGKLRKLEIQLWAKGNAGPVKDDTVKAK